MPGGLLERVAAAVAEHYRDLPLDGVAGVLLDTYWDGEASHLAPSALALREVHEDISRDGEQEDLGYRDISEMDPALFALCEQLNERLVDWEDESVSLEGYWLALAAKLRTRLGVPVLVPDLDSPIAEQLRRQIQHAPVADPLAGLDVVVRVPIDDHQVAAVVKRRGWLAAFARAGDPEAEVPLGAGMAEVGRDPHVVAGLLPHRTTGVAVQDRTRTWHEASVADGAWLCVLPQRAGVKPPAFNYLGPGGRRFTPEVGEWAGEFPYDDVGRYETAVLKGAAVPALWPAHALEQPIFCGWEGPRERASGLLFIGGDWVVSILAGTRDRTRTAGGSEEHGTIEGRPVVFELETSRGGWVAAATTDALTVVVECRDAWFGLDLVPR
jgi:hypothetical protein